MSVDSNPLEKWQVNPLEAGKHLLLAKIFWNKPFFPQGNGLLEQGFEST